VTVVIDLFMFITEALVIASKEIGLKVGAEKT
jgi:hypothetical protein